MVRRRDAVDRDLCLAAAGRSASWTLTRSDGVRCASAPLHDEPLAGAIIAALADVGLTPPASITLLRWSADDHGLPAGQGIGFLLDLTDGRLVDGGLLLSGGEPMTGWRPEAGGMALFDASRPPLLTVMAPHAVTPRVAVLGQTS